MVRSLAELYLEANAGLASLSGLENLKTIGSIGVFNQPALLSLAPLAGLGAISVNAVFKQNPLLSTCAIQALATRCGAPIVELDGNGPCN